ncbi:MAG: phage tail sheath family protein [Gemmatimonadetes bacterium]|nr:phage tail sheath family protein [Gemmatimonadota bacterium]
MPRTATLTPGVQWAGTFPEASGEVRTGIPAFLGYAAPGSAAADGAGVPRAVGSWAEFEAWAERVLPDAPPAPAAPPRFLPHAVRGFFRNGGVRCFVVPLAGVERDDPAAEARALAGALTALEEVGEVDLVCAPDVMHRVAAARRPGPWASGDSAALLERVRPLQQALLAHCRRMGDRFAILDAVPALTPEEALRQGKALVDSGAWGALYFPWVQAEDGPPEYAPPEDGARAVGGLVPPCGHVAGVYARVDALTGVHRPPANEPLEGVLDVEFALSEAQSGVLFPSPEEQRRDGLPAGINLLRAFSGRGIRVWGARTLSPRQADAQVAARRVVLSVSRWLEQRLQAVAFETNGPALWARITREVGGQLARLHRGGVLRGATPAEAFYVRCDAATNPPEARDAGVVTTEVGLAPAVPNEFIVVRVSHGAGGATITGPELPG